MPAPPSLPATIAVAAAAADLLARAEMVARQLHLPVVDDIRVAGFDYLLVVTAERLELRTVGPRAGGPLYADFIGGAMGYRRRHGGGRQQPLGRAVGLNRGRNPTVIDATAGLGRDGFVLASLGCSVHMIERSPIIAALLVDGLERAAVDPELAALIRQRLRLTVANSREIFKTEQPDVIYLDPMYPHRTKSALVKKEMRCIRALVGDDSDAPELVIAALNSATSRVVVKRPRLAPPVVDFPKASTAILSKNSRYDIYLP